MMTSKPAVEYLASAYEDMGYKVVALALRAHGPNAAKFKVEISAIESAIRGTREEDATIADKYDRNGTIGNAIRRVAGARQSLKA